MSLKQVLTIAGSDSGGGAGIQAMPNHPLRGGLRQVCATLVALAGLPAPANTTAPLAPAIASPTSVDYRRHFTPAAPPPAPASNQASSEEIAYRRAVGNRSVGLQQIVCCRAMTSHRTIVSSRARCLQTGRV